MVKHPATNFHLKNILVVFNSRHFKWFNYDYLEHLVLSKTAFYSTKEALWKTLVNDNLTPEENGFKGYLVRVPGKTDIIIKTF